MSKREKKIYNIRLFECVQTSIRCCSDIIYKNKHRKKKQIQIVHRFYTRAMVDVYMPMRQQAIDEITHVRNCQFL